METLRYVIKMDKKDSEYFIRPISDAHIGNPGHDEEKFAESIKLIHDNPYYYTIGLGDYVENNNAMNTRSQKTFDPEMMIKSKEPLLSQQIRKFRSVWEPIAKKTIGLGVGNHEDRTMTHDEFKLNFCEMLGINYLGDKAYINLNFTYKGNIVNQYNLIVTHSRFGGQQEGTVQQAAWREYNGYENFDAILFGHTHFCFAVKKYRKYLDTIAEKPALKTKKYYIINTGCFVSGEVEGYDSYADKKFSGGIREPATATIKFTPYNREIHAFT